MREPWRPPVLALVPLLLWCCGRSTPPTEEESRIREANQKIASYDGSREAFGNTEEARALAGRFATLFRQLREIGFSGQQKGMVTQGHFLTYCQVGPDRVCLLIHVPLLRKFSEDAQKSLLQLAWTTVSAMLQGKRGMQLGVGLRGVLMYDGVATGVVGEEPQQRLGLGGEKELHRFFTASPLPAAALPKVTPSLAPPPTLVPPEVSPSPEAPPARPAAETRTLLHFVVSLRDPSAETRRYGLAGIRRMGGAVAEGANPDVGRVLASDPDPAVRSDAAATLGLLGSPAARSALEKGLQDPDPAVREAVGRALREAVPPRP